MAWCVECIKLEGRCKCYMETSDPAVCACAYIYSMLDTK